MFFYENAYDEAQFSWGTRGVNIYLINLDRRPDRLSHMAGVLQRLGSSFERVAAVDGNLLPDADLPVGTALSRGEMGCLLSHRIAWQQIAASGAAYGVVLEDDIHVSPELALFVGDGNWIPPGADAITLEAARKPVALGVVPTAEHAGRRIRRLQSPHSGSAAYVISNRAAQVLLGRSEDRRRPSDAVLYDTWPMSGTPLAVYQVEPALCVQDSFLPQDEQMLHFGSDLQTERQVARRRGAANVLAKIGREISNPFIKLSRRLGAAAGNEVYWTKVPFSAGPLQATREAAVRDLRQTA